MIEFIERQIGFAENRNFEPFIESSSFAWSMPWIALRVNSKS